MSRTAREVRADLDAIEPLPDDGDVTAARMIRHFAVRAQERWTRMLTEDGGATEHLRISAMSAEYAVAHVLAALAETDPAAADSTAKVVADAILHPPGVGEWLWELLGHDTCKQVSKLTEELLNTDPACRACKHSLSDHYAFENATSGCDHPMGCECERFADAGRGVAGGGA